MKFNRMRFNRSATRDSFSIQGSISFASSANPVAIYANRTAKAIMLFHGNANAITVKRSRIVASMELSSSVNENRLIFPAIDADMRLEVVVNPLWLVHNAIDSSMSLAVGPIAPSFVYFETIDAKLEFTGQAVPITVKDTAIKAEMEFAATANGSIIIVNSLEAAMAFASVLYDPQVLGREHLSLPDLIIPPGSVLVIDTEAMTVTLDGVNVIQYFAPSSVFWRLKPGENLLVWEDGQLSRTADLSVVWKDRWI